MSTSFEGSLRKLGGPLHTTWQWRWFRLVETTLYYFKSSTEAINNLAIGHISLEDATITKAPSEWRVKFVIAIQALGRRLYLLAATSEQEQEMWLLHLLLTQKHKRAELTDEKAEHVHNIMRHSSQLIVATWSQRTDRLRSLLASRRPPFDEKAPTNSPPTSPTSWDGCGAMRHADNQFLSTLTADHDVIASSLAFCANVDHALLLFNVRLSDGVYMFVEGTRSQSTLVMLHSLGDLQIGVVYIVVDRNTTFLRLQRKSPTLVVVNGVEFDKATNGSTCPGQTRQPSHGPMELNEPITDALVASLGPLDPAISVNRPRPARSKTTMHDNPKALDAAAPRRDRLIDWADICNAATLSHNKSSNPRLSAVATTQGVLPHPLPQRPLTITFGGLSSSYFIL